MCTGEGCLWTMPIGIGDARPLTLDGVDAVELAELLAFTPDALGWRGADRHPGRSRRPPSAMARPSPPLRGASRQRPYRRCRRQFLPGCLRRRIIVADRPQDARWSQGRGNGVVPSPWQPTISASVGGSHIPRRFSVHPTEAISTSRPQQGQLHFSCRGAAAVGVDSHLQALRSRVTLRHALRRVWPVGREPTRIDAVGEKAVGVHPERLGDDLRVEADKEVDEPGRAQDPRDAADALARTRGYKPVPRVEPRNSSIPLPGSTLDPAGARCSGTARSNGPQ